MAKRHITPMGKHKPLGSSWAAMDTKAFSRSYEPETRPEFRCYVTGQQSNMLKAYEESQRKADRQKALEILESML